MRTHRLLSFSLLLFSLAACSGESEVITSTSQSAEALYNEARDLLDNKEYKSAVSAFEEVERQHPESPWAVDSQVMSAFSSYRAGDYDTAIGTLDRFVKLYPNHESTPYAYYLMALCSYEQISDVGRDQKMTQEALQALREVVRRFPDTSYARDAKIKLDLTVDHLAGKEMEVGRYYLRQRDYVAAANRFRNVVENYQTTSHVPEALHRLVETYLKLGVREEAQRYAAVLGHNFPASVWYRDSYRLLGEKPEGAPAPAESSWWDSIVP